MFVLILCVLSSLCHVAQNSVRIRFWSSLVKITFSIPLFQVRDTGNNGPHVRNHFVFFSFVSVIPDCILFHRKSRFISAWLPTWQRHPRLNAVKIVREAHALWIFLIKLYYCKQFNISYRAGFLLFPILGPTDFVCRCVCTVAFLIIPRHDVCIIAFSF